MAEWKKIIVSGSHAHLASVTASNLTNDNLVIAGTGGALESSGITFDGTIFNLGSSTLQTTGNISGSALSGSFFGDGSGLTGVSGEFPTTALNGTSLDTTKFFVNDGASKHISGSQVGDYVYSGVGGDATIAAGGTLTIANDAVEGTMLNTNAADTTTIELSSDTLSVLKVPNALTDTAGGGLNDFSYDGSSAVSLEVSGAAQLSNNAITKWNDSDGKFVVSSLTDDGTNITGTTSIQLTGASSNLSGSFSGSFTGDGTNLTGLATTLTVDGDTGTEDVSLTADDLQIIGTSNEVETAVTKVGNDVKVTVGLPNDVTIGNDLTVTGDLVVNGDQVNVNTTNLDIEDRFILLNSGSSATNNDSGIIFGGSTGAAQQGHGLFWDGSYNSDDGRLAIINSVNSTQNSDIGSPSYHLAGVFSGAENDAATAQADHEGNIRVDSAGDIFIYVA